MPITQDRMLALIAAAEAYRDTNRVMNQYAPQLLAKACAGELDLAAALFEWDRQMALLQPKIEHIETIAIEKQHFKNMASRNILAKNKQRRQRLRQGFQPRAEPSTANYEGPSDEAITAALNQTTSTTGQPSLSQLAEEIDKSDQDLLSADPFSSPPDKTQD